MSLIGKFLDSGDSYSRVQLVYGWGLLRIVVGVTARMERASPATAKDFYN